MKANGLTAQGVPWAMMRLLLGLVQMFGAALGAVLLVRMGPTPPVVVIALATTLLALLSRWLFRR